MDTAISRSAYCLILLRWSAIGRKLMFVLDSHQHFWQLTQPFDYGWLNLPQHAPIKRDFLPSHLQVHLEEVGVAQSIFVQTQHNLEENRWVLKLAEAHDFIAGVVGWVDLKSTDCESQLLEFKEHPKFVGVRHVTQDEPDDDFIIQPSVIAGLKVLERHAVPFDLLFYEKHLPHAVTLAQQLPELPMVINHLSKPQIKTGSYKNWAANLRKAAEYPNLYCKLSGMITEADWETWSVDDLKPYVETALECFGPSRCMFGSDWPVCELAGSYQQVYNALVESIGALSESEMADIFGSTAKRFYSLGH